MERIKVDHTEGLDLSSLKVAFNGAEPIKPQVMRRFEALFESRGFARTAWLPCYGLAEGTLIVSGIHHGQGYRLMEVSRSGLADGSAGPAVVAADAVELPSVGPAVPGLELLIVEPQTLLVQPPRKVGEIWAGGDSITQGYWCNREATAETFVMYEGKRYLRTGDLGFLDERHELYVTGRLKDLIVIDGKNHYPQDLELTAQSVDVLLRVNAGAAFSRVGEDGEKVVLVQEIATNDQGPWDSAQLLEIKNRIRAAVNREHAIAVDEVVFIGSNTIPKTTSGKIPRRQVKELYERRALKTIA